MRLWATYLRLLGASCALLGLGALASSCSGDDAQPAPRADACDEPGAIRSCFPGEPTAREVGACRDGESRCEQGVWTACEGFVVPADEQCEGALDENCNGLIDDGCSCESEEGPRSCYAGPATTRGIGICRVGVQRCVDAFWSTECDGDVLPETEQCNILDDDCDGMIDEDCRCADGASQSCYGGPGGTADVGRCRSGAQQCVAGAWSAACAGQVLPGQESCNAIDDDCDGATDEGDPGGGESCETGQPGICAAGTRRCVAGSLRCVGTASPLPETCDGRDEDCDGALDNGTFLPASFDAFEWIPAGWFGLPAGAFVIWGSRLGFWEEETGVVSFVAELDDAWNVLGSSGTLPPTSGISAVLALPAGVLGTGADSLWVAADTMLYTVDTATGVWQSSTIAASIGITDRIDAMTCFFPNEVPGMNEAMLVVVRQGHTWLYTPTGGWPVEPASTATTFCFPGSTGTCPPGVSSLSRIPGSPPGLLVGYGSQIWTSAWYPGAELPYYQWSTGDLSLVSCAH